MTEPTMDSSNINTALAERIGRLREQFEAEWLLVDQGGAEPGLCLAPAAIGPVAGNGEFAVHRGEPGDDGAGVRITVIGIGDLAIGVEHDAAARQRTLHAGAGLADGSMLRLGWRDCVAKDGACFLADKPVLAGSTSRMIDLVRTMMREAEVPLPEVIAMGSVNPAREAGLPSKGEIAVGKDADLVVLSPELEVVQTYVAGAQIFAR